MKPFVEGKNLYRLCRVPNPARPKQWDKPDTHFGYVVEWRVYWPLTGWRWFRRDDIGFCGSREEARYLIGLFEMQDGIARVNGLANAGD